MPSATIGRYNAARFKAKQARKQGGQTSITQEYKPIVPGRNEALNRAEPITDLIHPVDDAALSSFNEEPGHVAGAERENTDSRVSSFLDSGDVIAQRNRERIKKLKGSMIPEFGIADRVAAQDNQSNDQQKRLEEYSRLGNLLSGKLSDQKRRRTESKRAKLYFQIQDNLEYVEKLKKLKRKWTIMWEAGSLASTAEVEGAMGWTATLTGAASDSLQILKLILGKETLFTKWEPAKLDLTKADSYMVLMHFGLYVIFFGVIFVVAQVVFAFFGSILLQLAWIIDLAGSLYTAFNAVAG